jgi:hypothetical protein
MTTHKKRISASIPHVNSKPLISIIAFMNEDFELPVDYKGKEILFTARLLQQGFSYKIEVDVTTTKLLFEKDDQGDWRVIANTEQESAYGKTDVELLKAIAASLEQIFE